MRYLLALLLFCPLLASAANVTLTWEWPTEYCAVAPDPAEPLPLGDIQQAEIYISQTPIPRVPGACGPESDTPPPSAIIANVSTPNTTVDIDLACGATYHFVMRVQANGAWSNFSAEAMRVVDCGRPDIPIIISLS